MSDLEDAHGYLFDKWVEEDDDGINMIILDERRKRIEAEFKRRCATLELSHVDGYGTPMYPREALDGVWRDVSAKHPRQ